MRRKHYTINIILILALVAIVTNQAMWVSNMYYSYENEIIMEMNQLLEKTIYMEVTERNETQGGFTSISLFSEKSDTSRFITKEIMFVDTTIIITIDRQDPNANLKIIQYFLNDIAPVNLQRVNDIFFQEMQKGKYPVQRTYIEYYKLPENILVKSTNPDITPSNFITSDMIIMDIMETMGVKAYVESPLLTILGRMIFQLVLSVVLILIAIIGLFFLGRTIFVQWKQEKMRQTAINSMTHEFKRPIATAVSMISLIPYYLEKNNTGKATKYADDTLQELNKLTAYTERIQQISNNEHATVYLRYTEIEIKPFFNAICDKYRSSGKNNAIELNKTVDIQLNLQTVKSHLRADLLHFSNVMDNLIENAIKYSGSELVIIIHISDMNAHIRISVKDNGMGISKSDKKYIFEKYYRSRNNLAQQKTGFGLGLTYVKSIIETHNGKIEVESEIGKGSEFIIILPVKQQIVLN